jgi:hypothetical protein
MKMRFAFLRPDPDKLGPEILIRHVVILGLTAAFLAPSSTSFAFAESRADRRGGHQPVAILT